MAFVRKRSWASDLRGLGRCVAVTGCCHLERDEFKIILPGLPLGCWIAASAALSRYDGGVDCHIAVADRNDVGGFLRSASGKMGSVGA